MSKRRRIVAGLAALAFGISFVTAAARAEGVAPDFTLTDTAGKTVTLSALKGKVVFLDFWASWCPPCRASIPRVQQLHDKFKAANVAVLGINVENNARIAAEYARKEGITYPVLVGNGRAERDYRVSGIPAFFVIGADGKLLQRYEGYFPGMEKEWEKLIIKALKAGQAGKAR